MSSLRAFLRRNATLLVFLFGVAWIIIVVLLIIAFPEPGTGNPMALRG